MFLSYTREAELHSVERRVEKRARIVLACRVYCARKDGSVAARLIDISPAGVAAECTERYLPGDEVIVNLRALGRFEGMVVSPPGTRVRISFRHADRLRKEIAESLARHLGLPLFDRGTPRAAARVPATARESLAESSGRITPCAISDISHTGASLTTSARPGIEHIVRLGERAARVVRHHESGIGIAFELPSAPAEILA